MEWNVCASSLLLVPSTWLNSILCKCFTSCLSPFFSEIEYENFIVLAYFLALFMITMAHKHLYPDIWRRSIYEIVWFERRSHKISSKDYEDIENSSGQKQPYLISSPIEHTPPKAAAESVRRGIDTPFRKQNNTGSNSSSRKASTLTLPSYPNESAQSANGSRFIETFRESTRSESFAHFVASKVPKDPYPFPLDVDAPIPLPRLSEWVGADKMKGNSVHNRSSY